MFDVKRFAPVFAVFALGVFAAACDDVQREQQSEVPGQTEQAPESTDSTNQAVPRQ